MSKQKSSTSAEKREQKDAADSLADRHVPRESPQRQSVAKRKAFLNEGATITEAGSAASNRTGDWRTFRPVADLAKCTGCGICMKFCPDNALKIVDIKGQKKVKVDYEHCKGCLICAGECPFKAYSSERERRADTNAAEFKKEGVC